MDDEELAELVAYEMVRQWDWPTVKAAALLAAQAAVTVTGWWLCGKGYHWPDDGECLSCGARLGSAG